MKIHRIGKSSTSKLAPMQVIIGLDNLGNGITDGNMKLKYTGEIPALINIKRAEFNYADDTGIIKEYELVEPDCIDEYVMLDILGIEFPSLLPIAICNDGKVMYAHDIVYHDVVCGAHNDARVVVLIKDSDIFIVPKDWSEPLDYDGNSIITENVIKLMRDILIKSEMPRTHYDNYDPAFQQLNIDYTLLKDYSVMYRSPMFVATQYNDNHYLEYRMSIEYTRDNVLVTLSDDATKPDAIYIPYLRQLLNYITNTSEEEKMQLIQSTTFYKLNSRLFDKLDEPLI